MTRNRDADVRRMRDSGMTLQAIGKQLGVSRERIRQIVKRTGTEFDYESRFSARNREIRRKCETQTQAAIAREYGLSEDHIGLICRDVRRLRIAQIRLAFQPAECLIEETVQAYVDRLKRGDRLTPLRVRFDGASYFLEDGFHRLEAARRLRLKTVEARIIPGTLAEMETEYGDYLKRLRTELRRKRARIRSLRATLKSAF